MTCSRQTCCRSQELVSLLAPDTAAFLTVFSPLVQHCQQEAASTKLVSPKFQSLLLSLSQLMDVKTSLGSRPVAVAHLLVSFNHWFADPDLMAGRASSSSPTLFPVEDSAVVEQFLKGASLPLEELVRHGQVLHWLGRGWGRGKGPGRKERLTTFAPPASQGQQASGQIRPGGGQLAKIPFQAGIHIHQLGQRKQRRLELGAYHLGAGGLLLAVLHQQAEHSEECRRV